VSINSQGGIKRIDTDLAFIGFFSWVGGWVLGAAGGFNSQGGYLRIESARRALLFVFKGKALPVNLSEADWQGWPCRHAFIGMAKPLEQDMVTLSAAGGQGNHVLLGDDEQ